MPSLDFSDYLNPEQLEAVTAPNGPMLVLAAAGTGKTRTLVFRVAALLDHGVPPDRILLLTFTNKAAREMLERTEKATGRQVSDLWGGTFHHMANRLLRRHADKIGYDRDYTILDRDDSRSLMKDCLKDLSLDSKEFPKPDVLLSIWGIAANTASSLDRQIEKRFGENFDGSAMVKKAIETYNARKKNIAAMDFDDLLVNTVRLLRESPSVLNQYQERFLHVLVDEYQDTNVLQAEIVDRLAAKNGNLFVVGDDFQCIYTWRGASFENIMSFPEKHSDARTFMLETNYRSTPEILALANACIAGNPLQFQKRLRAVRPSGCRPVYARMRDGERQADYVIRQIARMKSEGFAPSEIAVLYRAHHHAMELQLLLTRSRVPYVITSGPRFFEQAHIKDVCSLVRIVHNPLDQVAFTRLLSLLPRVGRATALKAWESMGGRFDALDPARRAALRKVIPAGGGEAWAGVEGILDAWKRDSLDEDCGEAMRRFVEVFYAEYARDTFEDFERRLDDVEEMILYTVKFASVDEFLSDVALLTNLDSEAEERRGEGRKESVRLSTVHQAKGLEWRAVFVLWATEGMFPSARSMNESEDGEADERRLFYVAVTRAKDELHLCAPELRTKADGGIIGYMPSRFLREVPQECFRQVQLKGWV